jgi:hypothetical protein
MAIDGEGVERMVRLCDVTHAGSVLCRSCQHPIDVWFDHGLEIRRAGVTHHPDAARQLCVACLLPTFPPDRQERLAPAYEHERMAPREAGVPAGLTTYCLSVAGKPDTWSEGFLAVGFALQVRGWDGTSAERQPHFAVTPNDPSELSWSLVFVGGKVFLSTVKRAYLTFMWPFDLSRPARFEVVNGLDLALRDAELDALVRGRRFWRATIGSGRSVGTTSWTREDFLDELPRARQKLRVRHGRKPRNTELAAELGVSPATFHRYTKRWPGGRSG